MAGPGGLRTYSDVVMTDMQAAAVAGDAGAEPAEVPERPWPGVSVIMPVLDEELHLADSVREVLAQEYAGDLELIIALGPSKDGTERVAQGLAAADPRIRLVPNPTGRTPAGLNAALRAATHDIVVRVDGHGILTRGYVSRAVRLLERTGAANVGGLMLAVGVTAFQQAVARAYSSRVGLGGASFHVGGVEGPAETVYLGVFRRAVLEGLGGVDEHYVRAQDWELNYRIRQAGEVVWFAPDLGVTYRPRSSWTELVRQFFNTGRWRREVMRRHPDTVSVRYLAPPAATGAIVAGTAAGIVGVLGSVPALRWGFVPPVVYGVGLAAAPLVEGRGLSWP